jgi:hypothetical protein
MMPSLLIVHVQSLERAEAADKAAKLERCKLGGKIGGAADIKPQTREDPAMRAKFEDVGLDPDTDSKHALGGKIGGKHGGATDIKPQTREDLATRAKFEDVGLDPDTDSKHALGGKLSIHPHKGCNDEHFHSIHDQKNFANAAEARAGGWRVVKGHKSKTTGIQALAPRCA